MIKNQSKIEKLITSLCPNGVEYRQLGEMEDSGLIRLGRGNVISKVDITETPGDYPVYSSSAAGNGEIGRYGKFMFDDERITWSIDGGGKLFYRPASKYSVTNVCGWLKNLNENKVSTKYLYYSLTNEWVKKVFDYTHKAHPSVIRNEYKIPLPPLEIQKEIVKNLDKFTQLEAELEAELEARKRQYKYYRHTFLSFAEHENFKGLGELVDFINGKPHERLVTSDGDIALMTSKFISTQGKSARLLPSYAVLTPAFSSDIALVMSDLPNGRALAKAFFVAENNRYAANQRVCLLRVINQDLVNPKFLFYVVDRNRQLLRYDSGVDQTHLKKDWILNIKIPVPPMAEQERIVSILDKFDALVNDVSIGLPAELKARRLQYEYYRGKLLTFNEYVS